MLTWKKSHNWCHLDFNLVIMVQTFNEKREDKWSHSVEKSPVLLHHQIPAEHCNDMNIKQSNLMTENVNIQLSDEWWLRKEESDNYWMNKLKTTTLHLNPPAIALPSLFWLRLPVRPRRERNPEWLILTGLSFVNVTKKDCLVSPARLLFGRPKLLWHAFLSLSSWFYKCWRPIYDAGAALFRLKMYLLSCWCTAFSKWSCCVPWLEV